MTIFPNPFRPNDGNPLTGEDFTGSRTIDNKTGIHIIGLTADSRIDIFDINGRLVNSTQRIGDSGMAIWDGRDKNGKFAPTGIYFVLIEGTGVKTVEKLVIVR